ncbi:IclR family transcriptional regulator [Agrococcus sp. ARC_14]|uniref:IclR family transcriptional regulator n=1 Tax=Agrococcus sp. ARC_14 TaxID=2919927 RepID=UPI001F06DEC2|nr:IclR family transcriptional regulator [Agrococcus sp. ARC_14]
MSDTARADAGKPDAGGLQVVSRAAQILRMLDAEHTELRINEVAAELEIGRTSAHRYLQSLAAEGFLARVGDGAYRLGPLLAGLGAAMLASNRVVDLGRPLLQELAEATGETAVLGIWTGTNAVAVLCEEPRGKSVNMTVRIGAPLQADSAQGIAFLAHLREQPTVERVLRRATDAQRERVPGLVEEARTRGYATSASVLPGVAAIAVPAFDSSGQVAATVALVAASSVLEGDAREALAAELQATAARLSAQLGFSG